MHWSGSMSLNTGAPCKSVVESYSGWNPLPATTGTARPLTSQKRPGGALLVGPARFGYDEPYAENARRLPSLCQAASGPSCSSIARSIRRRAASSWPTMHFA